MTPMMEKKSSGRLWATYVVHPIQTKSARARGAPPRFDSVLLFAKAMMDAPDDDMFQQPRKMSPLLHIIIIKSRGHAPGSQNASLFLEMSSSSSSSSFTD